MSGHERQTHSKANTVFQIHMNIYFIGKMMGWQSPETVVLDSKTVKYWTKTEHFVYTKFIKMSRRINLQNHVANSNFNSRV